MTHPAEAYAAACKLAAITLDAAWAEWTDPDEIAEAREAVAYCRALAKALREGTVAWHLETDVERMYIDPPDTVSYTRVLVIDLPPTDTGAEK